MQAVKEKGDESVQIKEVEEKTGITSHNIRYYEKENLIQPHRNPTNGYREYTQEDINRINQIKLLRMLDVPVKSIRAYLQREVELKDIMKDNLQSLQMEEERIRNNQILSKQLLSSGAELSTLSEAWIQEVWNDKASYIKKMEEIRKEDRHKAKIFYGKQVIAIIGWQAAAVLSVWMFLDVLSGYVSREMLTVAVILIVLLFAYMFWMIWNNEKQNR